MSTTAQLAQASRPPSQAAARRRLPGFYITTNEFSNISNPAGTPFCNGTVLYAAFSMTGQSDYPRAGYVAVQDGQPTGPIHVAAAGTAPEDDFTCYPPFVTPAVGCRWGDYSAGAVWDGRIYMMTEYIPPAPGTRRATGDLRLERPDAVTRSDPG